MTGQEVDARRWRDCGRVIIDLFVLSRPFASACAGIALMIGWHLAGNASWSDGDAVLLRAATAILLVTAAVNVVNDIKDVRSDAISRPSRPLPAGRLPTWVAWLLAGVQAASALVLSIGVPAGMVVMSMLLLIGAGYSFMFKGTILLGNLVVALLAASPIVYGGYLGGARAAPTLITAAILFAFMFAYEVLKTIRDVGADCAVGCRTVATQWGTRAAASVFRLALMAYVVASVVPVIVDGVSADYVVLMGLGVIVPSLVVGWRFPVGSSSLAVRPALLVMTIAWLPGMVALAIATKG